MLLDGQDVSHPPRTSTGVLTVLLLLLLLLCLLPILLLLDKLRVLRLRVILDLLIRVIVQHLPPVLPGNHALSVIGILEHHLRSEIGQDGLAIREKPKHTLPELAHLERRELLAERLHDLVAVRRPRVQVRVQSAREEERGGGEEGGQIEEQGHAAEQRCRRDKKGRHLKGRHCRCVQGESRRVRASMQKEDCVDQTVKLPRAYNDAYS
mmetsp:Transcript_23251/g.57370  ORF Transcript_23251/g.57370 Transcript_23251/m.57370 type:complete len:209 (+) Transcript_23251:752-1378(+)